MAEHGFTQGVCLGTDGRVWDGHHRIVAAKRLGIELVPIEEDWFVFGWLSLLGFWEWCYRHRNSPRLRRYTDLVGITDPEED